MYSGVGNNFPGNEQLNQQGSKTYARKSVHSPLLPTPVNYLLSPNVVQGVHPAASSSYVYVPANATSMNYTQNDNRYSPSYPMSAQHDYQNSNPMSSPESCSSAFSYESVTSVNSVVSESSQQGSTQKKHQAVQTEIPFAESYDFSPLETLLGLNTAPYRAISKAFRLEQELTSIQNLLANQEKENREQQEKLNSENKKLIRRSQLLNTENIKLKKLISQTQQQNLFLKQNLFMSRDKNLKLDASLNQYRSLVKKVKTQNQLTDFILREKSKSVVKDQMKLQEAEKRLGIEANQKQLLIANYTEQLQQLENELADAKSKLNESQQQLDSQSLMQRKEFNKKTQMLKTKDDLIDELQKKLNMKDKKIGELQVAMQKLENEVKKQNSNSEKSKLQVERDSLAAFAKECSLMKEIQVLKNEISMFKNKEANQVSYVKQFIDKSKALLLQTANLTAEKEMLTQRVATLENEVKSLQDEIEDLDEETSIINEDAEKAERELEELKKTHLNTLTAFKQVLEDQTCNAEQIMKLKIQTNSRFFSLYEAKDSGTQTDSASEIPSNSITH